MLQFKQAQVTWLAFFAGLGAIIPRAVAIITFGGTGNNYTPPPGNIGSAEGLLGTGFAGTAISPRLMLTATHISGNTTGYFTLDGTKYNMQLEATLDDLAMWEIAPNDSASFPSYVPVYSGTNETNLPLVDVGYGVQRGAAIPGGWLWGAGNGQLSWGTNTVAAIVQDGDIGESANFGGDFLQYNFNNNPTDPNEGILAFGDSGGGLFVLNNGVYQLAGVNSVVDTVLNSSGVQLQAALYNQNGYFTQNYPGGPLIPITTNTPDSAYATRIASKSNLLGVVQGTITPANAAAFPINNDGALSVYTSMTTGAITGDPTLSIGTPFTPAVEATLQIAPNSGVSEISSLTIAPNNTLDITNTSLILDNVIPAVQTQIISYLATGYNGGKWNGPGISSSTAAASSGHYGVGIAGYGVAPGLHWGQLEVAYALYGDANLDGIVNGDDFDIMISNLGKVVTTGWQAGDFNYDGFVDGTDFTLLVGNFGKQSNGATIVLPASDWIALDAYAAANNISLIAVPEPTAAALLAIVSLQLLARRRPNPAPSPAMLAALN